MPEQINVLDKGYVKLLDWYGSDEDIVASARVSYDGAKTFRDNEKLIRYLMQHRHTSPFEMVDFKFEIKCPIFVCREVFRHRTFSYNEISGRYSILPDDFYEPEPERIQAQSKTNKQMSDADNVIEPSVAKSMISIYGDRQAELYNDYLFYADTIGVAREISRVNLPLSIYTKFHMKGNLHNLLHFLKLRLAPNAQWEIQEYARAMSSLVKPIVPITYAAFEDFVLNSLTISGPALELMGQFFDVKNLIKQAEKASKNDSAGDFGTILQGILPKQS